MAPEGRIASSGITRINELVNGTPARAWAYTTSGTDVRQFTTFAAYANEHVTAGRLTLDGGVRLDTVTGNANESARGIRWTNLLPRGSARLQIFNTADVSAVASYRRTAYQPTVNLLAVGDPAAPVADVSHSPSAGRNREKSSVNESRAQDDALGTPLRPDSTPSAAYYADKGRGSR